MRLMRTIPLLAAVFLTVGVKFCLDCIFEVRIT